MSFHQGNRLERSGGSAQSRLIQAARLVSMGRKPTNAKSNHQQRIAALANSKVQANFISPQVITYILLEKQSSRGCQAYHLR